MRALVGRYARSPVARAARPFSARCSGEDCWKFPSSHARSSGGRPASSGWGRQAGGKGEDYLAAAATAFSSSSGFLAWRSRGDGTSDMSVGVKLPISSSTDDSTTRKDFVPTRTAFNFPVLMYRRAVAVLWPSLSAVASMVRRRVGLGNFSDLLRTGYSTPLKSGPGRFLAPHGLG